MGGEEEGKSREEGSADKNECMGKDRIEGGRGRDGR